MGLLVLWHIHLPKSFKAKIRQNGFRIKQIHQLKGATEGSVFSQPKLVKTNVFRPDWLFIMVVQSINVKWRVFWYISIYLRCWVLSHLKALRQNHPKSASTSDHSQLRFVRPCFDRGMSIVRITLIHPHFKSKVLVHHPRNIISFDSKKQRNLQLMVPKSTSWAW